MKHIYSKSAFKKYRQSRGGSSTHYQRWTETFTEPSPGPSISRPNPPSNFTMRVRWFYYWNRGSWTLFQFFFSFRGPWGVIYSLHFYRESQSKESLFRPYVPTLEDLLSVGFHRSKGQAPTFMRTCSNMVLVNDAMFSHWYGISYPLRNPKHECAHFVNK